MLIILTIVPFFTLFCGRPSQSIMTVTPTANEESSELKTPCKKLPEKANGKQFILFFI